MFIKLTGAKVGPVYVNVESIVLIELGRVFGTQQECTAIFVRDVDGRFVVKETPEQIMEMIENARN